MAKDERKEEGKDSHAVIDRIEDGRIAVLLVGEGGKTQVDVPVSLLPEGAADGDHLRIHISLDRPARASAEERIKKLQDELKTQSGTTDKKDFKL
jgi:hypothetical protein